VGILKAVAINFQIQSTSDAVRLIPCGEVIGRDGRRWKLSNPQSVIDWCVRNARDIPVDLEHSTELKAPEGEPAPAVGWIKPSSLRIEDGHIVGVIEYNSESNPVANKEYRYLSPVFIYDTQPLEFIGLTSVGLTNNPNLYLPALNTAQLQQDETPMLKELLAALGLSETADGATALNAISQLKLARDTALNQAQTPSLDKFVPRADYDTALNRASAAESKLAAQAKAQAEAAIDTAINTALTAGKITPATVEYHKAQCRTEGGLERFKTFVDASPANPAAVESGLNQQQPGQLATALNAEEKQIASLLGMTENDYLAAKRMVGA
jgi:phage I-like protein